MSELRLGDVIDDHCIKCRRLTNHSIVSLVNGQVAKVRCRSCYHDHDYLHEVAPPSKKDLKKAELLAAVLGKGEAEVEPEEVLAAAVEPDEIPDEIAEEDPAVEPDEMAEEEAAVAAKPARAAAKRPAAAKKRARAKKS